jgi:sugar phosphate permease
VLFRNMVCLTVALASSFLFWLPVFLKSASDLDSKNSALFSTLFDAGGIVGGVVAGVTSDIKGGCQDGTGARSLGSWTARRPVGGYS